MAVEVLQRALPIAVADPALRDVLLQVLQGHVKLLGRRAVLRQVLQALGRQFAQLVRDGRLALERHLEDSLLLRLTRDAARRAGPVGAALVLAQRLGVTHVHDIAHGGNRHGSLERIRHRGSQDLQDGRHRRLHVNGEIIDPAARQDVIPVIHPLQRLLALRQGTDVLLDQRPDGLRLEVARDVDHRAGRILEEAAPVALDRLQAGLLQGFHADQDIARVVVIQGLVHLLLELVVRLVHIVGQDGLELVDTDLEFLRIEPRLREHQVHDLQGRLQVLDRRTAGDAMAQAAEIRADRQVLAREHLAHGRGREPTHAAVLQEQTEHVGLEARQVFRRDQALTALELHVEGDAVLLQVARIEDHLDTVGQHPFGGTVKDALGFLDLRPF